MIDVGKFSPEPALFEGTAHSECRASVIIPLRNEEASIAATLDALHEQVDLSGHSLAKNSYEILVLLNNCTDCSFDVIEEWREFHPQLELHVTERTLSAEVAHVGTARRLLMDAAWHRLHSQRRFVCGILSTDSDTRVASNWVAQNLRALEAGADAVGGVIELLPGEIDALPEGARCSYLLDRQYQNLVAELESVLDPLEYDPWPRHLEHFGASLACTPQAYALAGGLPPVVPLEDVAFVDELKRIEARLRHDTKVVVFTSARLDGRATVGLSYQLREWQRMSDRHEEHCVQSASWLKHELAIQATLRTMFMSSNLGVTVRGSLRVAVDRWASRGPWSEFLAHTETQRLIGKTFKGKRTQTIEVAIENLTEELRRLRLSTAGDDHNSV